MTVRYAAPGRINLIGEHTDYNRGFALPIALPTPTVVTYRPDRSDAIVVRSDRFADAVAIPVTTESGDATGWAGYVAGAIWATRDAVGAVPGGTMSVTGGVEPGTGLASSAALTCAVVGAVCTASGVDVDRMTHARIAQRAENEYVGAPTGLLDQLAALFAAPGHALLIDFDDFGVEHVPFAPSNAVLLVVDSRSPHRHAGGEYAARRSACERAAAELGVDSLREFTGEPTAIADPVTARRARHVLTENQRVLDTVAALREGDHAEVGRLMSASHASMRDDFEITTAELDLIAEVAVDAGAWGARMTGGGFGGCVIALCPVDADVTVRKALQHTGTVWSTVAGGGAGRA